MTPNVTFATFAELYAYIYAYIITNNNNEIRAVHHNNIESGLLYFITQSPRNYNNASVVLAVGNYTASSNECFLVFGESATGNITLTSNRWNEWLIVNKTSGSKSLAGTIANYIDVNGVTKDYIPSLSSINIAKGNDGIWYEVLNIVPITDNWKTVLSANFGIVAAAGSGVTTFGQINGKASAFGAEVATSFVISEDCQQSRLFVVTSSSQPASGDLVIMLRKNQADTLLKVTIPAGASAGVFSDTTNIVNIVAGDIICYQVFNAALSSAALLISIGSSLIKVS